MVGEDNRGDHRRTGADVAPVRAAQYVRMSTEHQQYSTDNQMKVICEYAAARGMEIVRTYADEGRSGLVLAGRDALSRLIADVESGTADFDAILVYDVSRWGRFQDADQSGYYEYRCRDAGKVVAYCAEPFENDGSPLSAIIKAVKRGMAGEYSRELSVKVFNGQGRLIEEGFRQGGPAGYGLRRMRVNDKGEPQGLLEVGERKSLQTDRVILVPGPSQEIETVRWLFRAFVDEGKRESEIAAALNARTIATDLGRPWTRGTVHQLLTNEKYIGNNVWNHRSFKLKAKRVVNPPEAWIRADGAFEGIVAPEVFFTAQGMIRERNRRFSNEEMLARLGQLFARHGYLSGLVIDECEEMPSSSAYSHRFGSLIRAYCLVGYTPRRDYRYIEINRALRRLHQEMVVEIVAGLEAVGAMVEPEPGSELLLVNGEFSLSIVIARCKATPTGALRWRLRFDTGLAPDITVAARMDARNARPLDYYLFPRIDRAGPRLRLAEDNDLSLDAYRFETLDLLHDLAAPVRIREAA